MRRIHNIEADVKDKVMSRIAFALGALMGAAVGAAGAVLLNQQFARQARPLAKAALKATLVAMHEAKLSGAEFAEAAEDLFAEARAETAADIAAAAAQSNAADTAAPPRRKKSANARATRPARKRGAVRPVAASGDG
jgi:gas vesicle protein